MANEFVARNGIIAQANSQITGSLTVTGGITGSLFGTSSFAVSASYILNSVSASYSINSTSASFAISASEANFLDGYTATAFVLNSQTSSMSVLSASYAATSSFASNFTVSNTLTAQTLVVQTVTSSIIYSSGSNAFGNNINNTQIFTGSVAVTGSLAVNGSNVILSNQTSSMSASYAVNSTTASYASNADLLDGIDSTRFATTSSLNTLSSSFNSYTSSLNSFSASIFSYTASQNARNGTYATTGSNNFIGTQNITGSLTISSSLAIDLNVIGGQNITGSLNITNTTGNTLLNVNADVFEITGSLYTTGSNIFIGTQTISGSLITTQPITGSLFGTASYATTASYALIAQTLLGSVTSASYALSASYASVAQTLLGSVTSASYALTSSYASNADLLDGIDSTRFANTSSLNTLSSSFNSYTSSLNGFSASIFSYTASQNARNGTYATTGSNTFIGNQIITGSLILSSSAIVELNVIGNQNITGSLTVTQPITGSLFGTSSYATTASYALTAQTLLGSVTSASYALTSSYASNADLLDGLNSTAFVLNSQTSSMSVLTAASASNITNAITNAADNRVLTANGGGTINGEANLTFDGTNLGIGTASPSTKLVIDGGTVNTTYTSSQARIADGTIHLMKTSAGGIFEAVRAMNLDTTAGTTVRLLAAATSDAFNNANGGKVFIDAIRTSTNMDLAFSLNSTAGAAPVERVRFMGSGNVGIGTSSPATLLDINSSTTNDRLTLSYGGSQKAVFGADTSGNTYLYHHTSATFAMYISAAGNFGIGNSSPGQKLEVSGIAYATSDFRAPIFYDSANTGYYVDPASTSNLVGLTVANTITGNITGNAGTASSVAWTNVSGRPSTIAGLLGVDSVDANPNSRLGSGYYQQETTTTANGWPVNGSWYHLHTVTHSNPGNYYSMQFAANFFANTLYYRSTNNSGTTAWSQVLLSTNYTSFTYTFDSLTSKASGTGTYTTSGDFRAPIFYDSDNTAYFINPNGSSNLLDVTINALGVGTAAPGTAGLIRATNDVVAYYSSDRRLKDNIKLIENPLEKISKIGGYEFDWNDKQEVYEGHDIGIIAQEIEEILPEIVTTRDSGYKAVKYEKIVPLLIEGIKEQQQQINELKELVNKLINK